MSSNACEKRLVDWFGLHSAHKLDFWQSFCILLNFAYFQQQNSGTYRSKFNFLSCFFGGYSERNWFKNFELRKSSFFFIVEHSINKIVKTFVLKYQTYFLAIFTFWTLYSTLLRVFIVHVFLLFTFFPAKQCWQMSTPCVDRSFSSFQILHW